ncbi:UNVERIFIED_CONTAM: hypothetical protein H355_007853 [Colinus virginianus]|nr:hypothetical protein H355_007853 [Colinus virginianus]
MVALLETLPYNHYYYYCSSYYYHCCYYYCYYYYYHCCYYYYYFHYYYYYYYRCQCVMPLKDAETYKWNVLDITKVWPHKDYPLIPVGKVVLNKNPHNYFQDVEQAAFSPAFMPPGIEPSEDRMLQGRLFSYSDTHRHRLGPNYLQIPVNRAWNARMGDYYSRDGFMCIDGNKGPELNYDPNSLLKAAKQDKEYAVSGSAVVSGSIFRHPQRHPNDDFEQPRNLYKHVMKEEDRKALIGNIVSHLKHARRKNRVTSSLCFTCVRRLKIQERQVALFYKVDRDYGTSENAKATQLTPALVA